MARRRDRGGVGALVASEFIVAWQTVGGVGRSGDRSRADRRLAVGFSSRSPRDA